MNGEYERYRAEVSEAYLEPIRLAGRKLRAKRAELMEERERAIGLTGFDYTRPIVASCASGDAVPDAVARLVALEAAYDEDLGDLSAMCDEARARLDEMGGRAAILLRLRYVSALPWNTVAEGMGLAKSTCKNMRMSALSKFFDYLPHTARPNEHLAFPEKI